MQKASEWKPLRIKLAAYLFEWWYCTCSGQFLDVANENTVAVEVDEIGFAQVIEY